MLYSRSAAAGITTGCGITGGTVGGGGGGYRSHDLNVNNQFYAYNTLTKKLSCGCIDLTLYFQMSFMHCFFFDGTTLFGYSKTMKSSEFCLLKTFLIWQLCYYYEYNINLYCSYIS